MRLLRVLLLAIPIALLAQIETTTSIRGLVTDQTRAAVQGAAITIRHVETNEERSTKTDGTGFYAFPSLLPGSYNITASHSGFKRSVVSGRVAEVSQSAQVDFVLQLGETSQSVTITAEGAELLTTSGSEVSGTLSAEMVDNLPLNGHDFFDLAATMPQVSSEILGNQLSQASRTMNLTLGLSQTSPMFRSSGIFAAGNPDSATTTSIDGLNVQSSVYGQTTPQEPTPAIQEMKIQVSGMNAEFGNGVAAVNIITKSGTNRFHGDAYEYLRNDALDANNFFNNLNRKAKSPYRQNQFGAAGGGPIVKNRVFFFSAYEGLRVRQANLDVSANPPPADIRGGDFSAFRPPPVGGKVQPVPTIYNPGNYNPTTGLRVPFSGNKIPTSAEDPVSLAFLNNWEEQPNTVVGGQPRFIGNTRQVVNEDQGLMRIDWVHGTSTRVYGRFTRAETPSVNKSVESLAGTSQNASDFNAVAHWTQIISPTTLSDVMVGYARPNWLGGRDINLPDVDAAIGLKNASTLGGGPFFSNGYSMNGLNGGPYMGGPDNIFQAGGDLTQIRGRHSLKFGFQAIERRLFWLTNGNDKGTFTFTTAFTNACPDGNAVCTAMANAGGGAGGNAFASYLLGLPTAITFTLNSAAFHGQRRYYGAYAQDSWRVNSRLTLNYGLRYELYRPWFLPRHTDAAFNRQTGAIEYVLQNPLDYLNPATGYGRTAALNPNLPATGYTQSTLNLSPRAGLAYSITSSTVFRAGYGIYYDGNVLTSSLSNFASSVGPFRLVYNATAATNVQFPALHVNGSFPFPNPTAVPAPNSNPLASFDYLEQYYPLPSVQEWTANLQQRLGKNWTAEINYTGTHVVHELQEADVNPATLPQGALASVPINSRRLYTQWGSVLTFLPIGYSRYQGLAGTLRNVRWKGITLISSVTFAKNLTSYNAATQNSGNLDFEYAYLWRGPSHLTPKLNSTTSWTYQLPFAALSHGWRSALIGGWSLNGIVQISTGIPNFITTTDNSGTGYGTMPNRICNASNVPGGRSRTEWFNTACFVQPAFGTFGNSNFGVYTDPGLNNWNVGVSKNIKLGLPIEGNRLQFRSEFFNVWNHTQWGPAVAMTTVASPTAGQISSTRPPRQIQMSLHYIF